MPLEPIEIEDDGFLVVNIKTPDGAGQSQRIDVYVLGQAILRKYRDLKGQDQADQFIPWLIEFFGVQGLPGLSGKAADELAAKLIKATEEIEKKSEPTPSPA